MIKYIPCFFILLAINSCRISGLTNDYNKLRKEEKEKIIDFKNFQETETEYIYPITGEQLREELKKHPQSLVYILTNGCTSEYCKPLNVYINYAETHDLKLFFVMDGYNNLQSTLKQGVQMPFYAINNEFYNITSRMKYLRVFENDLLNRATDYREKKYYGDLYFFEKDSLIKISRDLPHSSQMNEGLNQINP